MDQRKRVGYKFPNSSAKQATTRGNHYPPDSISDWPLSKPPIPANKIPSSTPPENVQKAAARNHNLRETAAKTQCTSAGITTHRHLGFAPFKFQPSTLTRSHRIGRWQPLKHTRLRISICRRHSAIRLTTTTVGLFAGWSLYHDHFHLILRPLVARKVNPHYVKFTILPIFFHFNIYSVIDYSK